MAHSKTRHAFFDYPYPIPFAHRGGNEVYPENTMAAFENAYSLGYRYFETDVHYTVGNELVAFHDTDLLRTTGSSNKIATLTAAERKRILFEDTYPIPLLSELLEHFPDAYFNIDAKSAAAVEPLVATLKKHGALDRACIVSFSPKSTKQLRQLAPGTPTAATRYEGIALRLPGTHTQLLNGESRYLEVPAYVFWNKRKLPIINRQFVQKLHDHNHKLYIWTANEEKEIRWLLEMGVDGLFTDKPRLLKQILQSRNEWLEPK